MTKLNLSLSRNNNKKEDIFVNNSNFIPEDILHARYEVNWNYICLLELFNPFNLLIFSYWFNNNINEEIQFKFNNKMPSGLYYIKIQYYIQEVDQELIQEEDQYSSLEFISIKFSGKFLNNEWFLVYAINLQTIPGLEIRIAIPKENFPFVMVDSFQGIPVESITTDVWSNWLVFITKSDMNRNLTFGYRSWINLNYLLFSPNVFEDEPNQNQDLGKFLVSEAGIECSDEYIKNFATRIKSKYVLGIVHQSIDLVKSHLKFKEQQGEFGAKYALLNKQGDCTEFSALFTALCRIKNIPSRLVAGLKLDSNSNNWIRHAWSEFYYKGLWVPVDVVEGYIIGNHPEIIPLFKGNWMAEGMAREVKISILPEFEDQISLEQLTETYFSLNISYKVYSKDEAPEKQQFNTEIRSTYSYSFDFVIQQESNALNSISFYSPFQEKQFIICVYYKHHDEHFNESPKIIHHILHVIEENQNKEIKIIFRSPEFPSFYEQGIIICSLYGELLIWEKSIVEVS